MKAEWLPAEVEMFLTRQKIGQGIGALVAWGSKRGMSIKRVFWPSNMYGNRHEERRLLKMKRTAATLGRKTKKSYRKTVARKKAKMARKARKR